MYKTRKLKLGQSDQLDELAEASAKLWNDVCKWYWRTVDRQDHWLSVKAFKRWHAKSHESFHSQTSQAVVEQFHNAIKSWHRNDRKGNLPRNTSKEWNKIQWKSQAIKLKDNGDLRLSNGRGNDPVLINWKVGKEPVQVEIGWTASHWTGEYEARATYKVETEDKTTGSEVAGIDLGEKHLAAVATSQDAFLINGGKLRAVRHYQNKLKSTLQAKIDTKERGSNRWKKLIKTRDKQLDHIQNKVEDILHKLSRKLIEMLLERGVSTVAVGKLKNI